MDRTIATYANTPNAINTLGDEATPTTQPTADLIRFDAL